MNAIRYPELVQLAKQAGRCISIYMPTYRAAAVAHDNQPRFKALLKTASEAIQSRGLSETDTHSFLEPASQLLGRLAFWQEVRRGLAIFISGQNIRAFHMAFECEELCIAGNRFHVTPLIQWLNEDASYYLLAVSQNSARLLHGTRCTLDEVDVPDLPSSRDEALNYDPREGFYQTHSGQPQLRGKEGIVFTGQGGEVDVAKDEISSYFRLIDIAVSRCLATQSEPLLFAGVDYLYSIYRRQNHYSHLVFKHIAGNPDLFSSPDLRKRAWMIIESLLRERQETAIARYWEFVGQGRSCNRMEDILDAADTGMVETLFVCPAIRRWGKYDSNSQTVHLDRGPAPDNQELINLAVCLVLKHHGTVESIVSGNIPGGGSMAAVLRFTAIPAIV